MNKRVLKVGMHRSTVYITYNGWFGSTLLEKSESLPLTHHLSLSFSPDVEGRGEAGQGA